MPKPSLNAGQTISGVRIENPFAKMQQATAPAPFQANVCGEPRCSYRSRNRPGRRLAPAGFSRIGEICAALAFSLGYDFSGFPVCGCLSSRFRQISADVGIAKVRYDVPVQASDKMGAEEADVADRRIRPGFFPVFCQKAILCSCRF